MKAVFTHKVRSIYDDLPEERYHFPRTYLRQVEAVIGDFIVYYEPGRTGTGDRQRTGRRAYTATAQVIAIKNDPRHKEYYYAIIDASSYVSFDRPVPFREQGHYYEQQLERQDGKTSKGAFGRAVRLLAHEEYESIVRAGFVADLDLIGAGSPAEGAFSFPEHLAEAPATFERPIVERLLSRPVRDAAFARAVQRAYAATCAMTGLKLINGGGRAEVQAAHIRPVHDQGPDSIRNGIALSGTIHWLFDRGLVSLGPPPSYEILFSSHRLPDNAMRLFNQSRRLSLPKDERLWPAPAYVDYHRNTIFKA